MTVTQLHARTRTQILAAKCNPACTLTVNETPTQTLIAATTMRSLTRNTILTLTGTRYLTTTLLLIPFPRTPTPLIPSSHLTGGSTLARLKLYRGREEQLRQLIVP